MAAMNTQPVGKSIDGAKGPGRNEDTFTIIAIRDVQIIVVFDGHGINGQRISKYCKYTSESEFEKISEVCESWSPEQWVDFLDNHYDLLHNGFRNLLIDTSNNEYYVDEDKVVRNKYNHSAYNGGTTATIIISMCYKGKSYVISSNVGDSDAFIVKLNKPAEPIEITTSHGADNSDEFKRIKGLNLGRKTLLQVYDKNTEYDKTKCPQIFDSDGNKVEPYNSNPLGNGLHQCTVRGDIATYSVSPFGYCDKFANALTRTIGNYPAHPCGFTHKPTIKIFEITNESIIVAGSDGVWDCWKNEIFFPELCEVFQKTQSLEETCDFMIGKTLKTAKQTFSKHFDDITLTMMKPINQIELPESNDFANSIEQNIASEIVDSIIQQENVNVLVVGAEVGVEVVGAEVGVEVVGAEVVVEVEVVSDNTNPSHEMKKQKLY